IMTICFILFVAARNHWPHTCSAMTKRRKASFENTYPLAEVASTMYGSISSRPIYLLGVWPIRELAVTTEFMNLLHFPIKNQSSKRRLGVNPTGNTRPTTQQSDRK